MRTALAAAILAIAVLMMAPAARADILYEQVGSGTNAVISFDFPTALDADDNQGADDFNVPAGEAWTIDSVDVFGAALQGSNGTDTGSAFLYSDSGGLPGTQLFAQSGITLTGGTCSVGGQCNPSVALINPPKLSPGNYWASVQTRGPYSWGWEVLNGAPQGASAVWRNPGGGLGHGCQAYTALAGCNVKPASAGNDFFFRLNGTLIDSRFSLGRFKLKRHNKVVLSAKFPGAGTAVVQDAATAKRTARASASRKKAKIKKLSIPVGGAVSKNLPIRLTRFAKAQLNRKHKLKVTVLVTFTATGGAAFSQRGKLTLHQR